MLRKHTCFILTPVVFVSGSLLAQQEGGVSETLKLPDEILITQDRSAWQLRDQILDAEEQLYDIFNKLVDDKRFKIFCSNYKRQNSNIATRECLPEFQRRATRIEGQAYLDVKRTQMGNIGELPEGSVPLGYAPPTEVVIALQQKELKARLEEIARTSPEFQQALINYVEMKERYTRSFGKAAEQGSDQRPVR